MKKQQSGLSDGIGEASELLARISAIRAEIVSSKAVPPALLDRIHPSQRESARNLLHYLALRKRDLRGLQARLAALGLSSLGRAESQVLANIDLVEGALRHLAGQVNETSAPEPIPFTQGQERLAAHTEELLGRSASGRTVRIMVTMPGEAAHDYALVHDLLRDGMDCARINCAHDNAATWLRIIEHVRRAEDVLSRTCRIVMDLGGPKLRTGPLLPGPAVVRIRPRRDLFGCVTAPARVWLSAEESPATPPSRADACLPVPGNWLGGLKLGDVLEFRDARRARRGMRVVDVIPQGCWAELTETAYLIPGTRLRPRAKSGKLVGAAAMLGALPPVETVLSLHEGDLLMVSRDLEPGRPATVDSAGRVLTPAIVGCTLPEVFDDVRPGEQICFDDGKIRGVVETVEVGHVLVKITHTRLGGGKLRADKGINLPESKLRLAALTAKDIEDLDFVTQHADVVELSFANCAADVEGIYRHFERLGTRRPGLVLKIETRRGFENLPDMLLHAMRWPSCGVMIARGDLAVECGFERLAEVQEEILWICEAAHVPVIWATQVLENLAKEGLPSRSEITDAAMGHRAECVMLNKGPHIVAAVSALDDILRRMQDHQSKKRSMLRELHLAHALDERS